MIYKESYRYKTVLVVDDNQVDSLIGSKVLSSSCYAEKVLVIQSAHAAIDFIRECVALRKDIPEVLFLDLRMPEMSGFDFVNALGMIEGLTTDDLKVYVLSSSLDPKDFSMIRRNKLISRFIGKPLTAEILQAI
jgi:CheY-like chemotaxis protein